MSVALTAPQVRARVKTVTRRWERTPAGRRIFTVPAGLPDETRAEFSRMAEAWSGELREVGPEGRRREGAP